MLLKSALRGILPDAILNRAKMGFGIPLGQWLRTSLKEQLTDTVLSERAMQRGYFKLEVVRDMVHSHMAEGIGTRTLCGTFFNSSCGIALSSTKHRFHGNCS